MTSRSEGGGGQGFLEGTVKAFLLKSVTMRGMGSKIIQNFVTSFLDDPIFKVKGKEP